MDDELTGLLAQGERAAFHGRPGAGVGPLQRAVELAHRAGRDAEATAAAWLLGVCLGAGGHYGAALTVLAPLSAADTDRPDRQLFSSLASSTVASVHRQLGRHEDARAWDEQARVLAGDAPEAVFDAELGLAADAIGLGQEGTASSALDAAEQLVADRADWWRQRVRLGWVRGELALLAQRPADAVEHTAAAVALAEASGAPRHVAKGTMFTGIGQVQLGDLDAAAASLRRAAGLAESLGAVPLVWPTRALLGALVAGTAPDESERALDSARTVVRQIAAELPPDYADAFLARDDVAALLAAPPSSPSPYSDR